MELKTFIKVSSCKKVADPLRIPLQYETNDYY